MWLSYGPRAVLGNLGPQGALAVAGPAQPPAAARSEAALTAPDVVTLAGYGLGVWWGLGGPAWAGLASVAADEVDGRLARATGAATEHGGALDWGADVALTPLALYRLGGALGHPRAALLAAPPVLYVQALLRTASWRPSVGSARAVLTVAAIGVEYVRSRSRRHARR